jgi:hypothetical protein
MRSELQTIIRHALTTLPDSITRRIELLHAVRLCSDRDSDERVQANLLLEQLKEHERTQMTFPLQPSPEIPAEIFNSIFSDSTKRKRR